jgi:hypothetical protein
LEELRDGNNKGEIDSGTLIYVCALMHREAYDAGDYLPAVKEFQRQMVILTKIHNRRCTLIFDGMNGRDSTTNIRGATAMGCGKAPPTSLWCGCPNQQFLRAPM